MALPPSAAKGSAPVFMVSNMRQSSEKIMMENMSFPTPRGTARLRRAASPDSAAARLSGASALPTASPSVAPLAAAAPGFPNSVAQGCPVRWA